MKLFGIQSHEQSKNVNFEGKRINRNIVSQLAKNNPYSINDPNSRLITNAIAELGKVAGKENIKFLMDVAAKSTYSTNIKLQDMPKKDWKKMLLAAAASVLAITPLLGQKYYTKLIEQIANNTELNETEQQILEQRKQLLESVDLKQIKEETVGGIRDFEKNLNYFIVSSETTQEHKKYVLEKLNYFMSDEYKINPQLKDKKSIVVAEMINDMAIATPGNKIPNIKAVYQKHHGMCAAISIVRKKLAYEDKPNYVDSILSELDDKDVMMVYDRSKLGTGKKVEVRKVPVDFNAAINKGYRIIDASTMHWMQVAQMTGYSNGSYRVYNPFDDENFDVKTDSFFNTKFYDEDLIIVQNYYQALVKTKQILEEYKAANIKNAENARNVRLDKTEDIKLMSRTSALLTDKISVALPDVDSEAVRTIVGNVLKLERKYSSKINKDEKFAYVVNEEDSVKQAKIKGYIQSVYPAASISDELAGEIYNLVDYYNELKSGINIAKNTKLKEAEDLYHIAAAFRYQFLMSLEEVHTLDNLIHQEGIPNKESLMLALIDKYIDKLENNSGDSAIIRKHFAQVFDDGEPTNADVIEFLDALKSNLQAIVTDGFDNLYYAMTMDSRKGAMITYISSIIETLEADNSGLSINLVASRLGVEPHKKVVIKALEKLKQSVENGGEEECMHAFNLVGNTTQTSFLKSVYEDFIAKLSADDNKEFVTNFLALHNLPIEDNEQVAMSVISQIGEQIDSMTNLLDSYAAILKIKDEDGDILYTPEPKEVVIKNFENSDIVVSAKKLRELKIHLDKILKDQSSDEFNSRQGKLKDRTLYDFSNREKDTLTVIKNNINPYYSQVQKSLRSVRQEMQYPLEELSRVIGVNGGSWWVSSEGHSGLQGSKQVRILEFMTGRPHYIDKDLKEAIEKIKNSPYSGISSSSVFHDKDGWHAQYIADIAPVEIKHKDGSAEIKEVLFQDNTWGVSEHENTWIDSNGLLRTDYSDRRGGSLGYITDDNYRNGNFVERVVGDMIKIDEPDTVQSRVYKRITHPQKTGWSAPQYTDIIMQGDSPELYNLADQIRDAMFTPTAKLADTIKLFTANLTEQQIKDKIKKMGLVEDAYKPTYQRIISRILPAYGKEMENTPRIMSLEEYNNLRDDDILKIALENIALYHNYPLTGKLVDLSKVRDVKELDKYRKEQIRRASNDLKYSFGKNLDLIEYLADSYTLEDEKLIEDLLKKHGITLTDDELNELVGKMVASTEKFNGSLKDTINDIMQGLSHNIDKIVKDLDARVELKHTLRKMIKDKLYFNESDLENKDIEHIIKFIDRVYDPADNKEFVKIFRSIQDMTKEEFQSEILSKATPADLGIKNETGYDVLVKLQRYEEDAERDLLNEIWRREYYNVVEHEPVKQSYYFKKLHRRPKNLMKYNFEIAYREMKNDLLMLNYRKLFNKYKGSGLEQYGAYPAYPDVTNALLGENMYKTSWDYTIGNIEDMIEKVAVTNSIIKLFENEDKLKELVNSIGNDYLLSEKEYSDLNNILGQIATTLYGERGMDAAYDKANDIMDYPIETKFGQYKADIGELVSLIEKYKEHFENDSLNQIVETNKMIIGKQNEIFVKTLIQKRYQPKVMEMVNKYERALKKKDPNVAQYKEELWQAYRQYHILQNPKEVLDVYLESLAGDSDLAVASTNLETLVKRALNYARLLEVQSILMDALSQGVETDVKKEFDKVSLELVDGDVVNMGEDDIISQIVYQLVIDEQVETARMFLDKFGLNENYVIDTAKNFKYDSIKSKMDEAAKCLDNFVKFSKDYETLVEEVYKDMAAGGSSIKILNKFKKAMAASGKKYAIDKNAMTEFMGRIDVLKNYLIDHPDINAETIARGSIQSDMADLAKVEQERWNHINDILGGTEAICNLANMVSINPDSEAYAIREKMNEKFAELTAYCKTINSDFDDLPDEE